MIMATGSFNFKPDLIEMQNDSTQESYFGREVFNCFHRVKAHLLYKKKTKLKMLYISD